MDKIIFELFKVLPLVHLHLVMILSTLAINLAAMMTPI
jgi:hypothetical protein